MATPGPAVLSAEACEALSEIYLLLWRQLARFTQADKWLEIRPTTSAALEERVRISMQAIAPDTSSLLFSDYQKTQDFLSAGSGQNTTEVEQFRDYLRDNGLRYAQLADERLWPLAEASSE